MHTLSRISKYTCDDCGISVEADVATIGPKELLHWYSISSMNTAVEGPLKPKKYYERHFCSFRCLVSYLKDTSDPTTAIPIK